MSTEENKAIFRRHIEEVGNQGNLDLADEIFVRYLAHQPDGSVLIRGPEDVKHFTGEEMDIRGIGIFRFSPEGKVVESWDSFDQLSLMRQSIEQELRMAL